MNSPFLDFLCVFCGADLDEHAHMPTRFKVSEMYARLVLRCQGHVASDNGNLKLPYDVFLRRLLQLQSLYDGSEGANVPLCTTFTISC